MRAYVVLLLAGAPLLVCGVGCRQPARSRAQEVKATVARLNAAAGDLAKGPSKEQLTSEPYIKGKLVLIRRNPGYAAFYVDGFDAEQLWDVWAQTPEEALTVALLDNCRRTQRGVYRTDENPPRELPAFSTECDLTLIDRSIPAVILKRRFEGKLGEKAGVIRSTEEVNAFPDYEVRDFLKSLPRR